MKPYIWFVNMTLLLNHISAQWQTYLLSYLQITEDPFYNIKIDLGMSSFQNDIVNGAVFTFTNGCAGLIWGALADVYPRKWMWCIAVICWTGASLLISFTQDFVQILLCRILFAIFMATSIPLSVSLLSDFTMPHERGLAQSIFASGIYLGVGMSSLSVIIDNAVGWRNTVRIICVICIVFLVPQFFVKEPVRNGTNMLALQNLQDSEVTDQGDDPLLKSSESQPSPKQRTKSRQELVEERVASHLRQESLFDINGDASKMTFLEKCKVLLTNWCFMSLMLAGFFRFFGGYSLGFLTAEFFETKYPDYTNQFAIMNSVIVIGGGLPASIIGGYLSDSLEAKYGSIKGLIAGCGALAAVPFIIISYAWQPSFWGSILSYYVAYFVAEMWYGPSHAQINNMFPSEFQGFAVAVFNFVGCVAGSIATLTLGAIKDQVAPDTLPSDRIATLDGYVLTGGVLFSYLICGPLFIISGFSYAKQLKSLKSTVTSQVLYEEENDAREKGKRSVQGKDE